MAKEYEGLRQSDEFLLEENKEESCQEHEDSYSGHSSRRWCAAWKTNAVILVLLVSLVQNGLLYQRNKSLVKQASMGISKYSKWPISQVLMSSHQGSWLAHQHPQGVHVQYRLLWRK